MSTFQIRRGADRARTRTEWLDSRHSFAFGSHYDPDNIGFGLLLAHNSDVLQPGAGYPVHAHRDVEILTWVMAGSLVHQECGGTATVIPAGQLHHLSAGSGIRHTEFSADERPVHVVQMWLAPDEFGLPPSHRSLPVAERLAGGGLVRVASGSADPESPDVLRIRQRAAALSVARLPAGAAVTLPAARYVHVFLTSGSATVQPPDGEPVGTLAAGDALRITDGGGERLAAEQPAELLVWQMDARRGAS
ncbi:MAG TPA: pirin family protein [Jatrophihabitans sp.]